MDDLISKKALLPAYDNAVVLPFAIGEKKKVKDYDYALPIYDTDGYQNDVLFMYRARCPKCSYVILDGDFQKFEANDLEINFCVRCGQALDWSDADE